MSVPFSVSGVNVDCELAGRVDGVDVFVGGHTHSLLSNTNPKAVAPAVDCAAPPTHIRKI